MSMEHLLTVIGAVESVTGAKKCKRCGKYPEVYTGLIKSGQIGKYAVTCGCWGVIWREAELEDAVRVWNSRAYPEDRHDGGLDNKITGECSQDRSDGGYLDTAAYKANIITGECSQVKQCQNKATKIVVDPAKPYHIYVCDEHVKLFTFEAIDYSGSEQCCLMVNNDG